MADTRPNSRILILMAVLYSAMLVYASLMPFRFTSPINMTTLFSDGFWSQWPFNPSARVSGSDVVSNLILYTPLGFLLTTGMTLRFPRSKFAAIFFATLLCAALSLGIETCQSGVGFRTPSVSDWLLNTLSGLIGATIGTTVGSTYYYDVKRWAQKRWENSPIDLFTLLVLILVIAEALSPFLPTIKLSQVWKSIKSSHFNPIDGFSQHPWHWWLVLKILPYHLLGLLFAAWNHAALTRRRLINTAIYTMLLAVFLEILKLMLVSRHINIANPLTAGIGAFLILLSGRHISQPFNKRLLESLSLSFVLIYLLYLGWTPFDFNFNWHSAAEKLPTKFVEFLPFYHYAMGATLEHVRLFIQNIILVGMLIYLLRLRFIRFDQSHFRLSIAIPICILLGVLQEGGQLFLPLRTPSLTDIYCFMIGGYLGCKTPLNRHLSQR